LKYIRKYETDVSCTSTFNTMSRALNSVFLYNMRHNKSNMADGRHFENSYISILHISAANRPNLTKFGTHTQISTQATERWQKFRNSQIQDGGCTSYWTSFLAI